MRPVRHLTPRYVYNRIRWKAFHRRYPGLPYLNREVVAILDDLLWTDDIGLEWGAGASTVWFAARCRQLVSIEHDPGWAARVRRSLERQGLIGTVDLRLFAWSRDAGVPVAYVDTVQEITDCSLDFAIVDGRKRDACALLALSKVKPGGLLIVDDVHRYLPRERPSPTPHARGRKDGCASAKWEQFKAVVDDWRCIWRTDGVSDTALWIKPSARPALFAQSDAATESLSLQGRGHDTA